MSHMSLIRCLVLFSSLLAISANAAPPEEGIAPVTVTPSWLPPDTPTSVTITATIAHPHVVPRSVILQERLEEQWEGVGHLTQDPSDLTQFSLTLTRTEPPGTAVQFRVSAAFRGQLRRGLSSVLTVPVATRAEPQEETTILDPLNPDIQLILPEDSLTTPVYATVTTQESEALTVDLGGRTPDLVLDITLQPEGISPDTVLTRPYQLNVPAPADAPEGTRFNVAVPILADAPEGGGLREQLLAVDTAIVENGYLLTRATELEGLFYDGTVLFLRELGSGIAEGRVVDENDFPRAGVYVHAELLHADDTPAEGASNSFVFLTDDEGRFRLPLDPNPPSTPKFRVQAIDGQRCGRGGSAPMAVPTGGAVITMADTVKILNLPGVIGLDASIIHQYLSPHFSTRMGIGTDGGFELGKPRGCRMNLQLQPSQSPSSLFAGPDPSEGQWMGTGRLNRGLQRILVAQKFQVPRGARTLSFDYWSTGSSQGNPTFLVNLTRDPATLDWPFNYNDYSDVEFLEWSWPIASGFRTGSVDVSAFTATEDPVFLGLEFHCKTCLGPPLLPNIDLPFSVDNIRFGTVFLDVKILDGAMADLLDDSARLARVQEQVRDTNEILAQVGVNVRLGRVVTPTQAFNERGELLSTHPCPGLLTEPSLLDIAYASDIEEGNELPTPNGQLQDLLSRCRSTTSTDVNVYFVKILRKIPDDGMDPVTTDESRNNKFGLAIGADDYHLDGTPGPGLIIRNMQNLDTTEVIKADRQREVLAHELGHLLIGGVRTEQPLEHDTLGGNLMSKRRCSRLGETNVNPVPCSSRAIMLPEQSEQIHATNGGGFLVD